MRHFNESGASLSDLRCSPLQGRVGRIAICVLPPARQRLGHWLTGWVTVQLEGCEKAKVALTKSADHRGPGRSPAAGVETVTPKPSSSHVAHSRRRSLPITPPNWRQSLRAFFRSPSMASASILSNGDSAITATPLKRGDRRPPSRRSVVWVLIDPRRLQPVDLLKPGF